MNDDIDPDLKSTLKWAKKISEPKAPAGLETRILARLEAKQRERSRKPWLWGLSGGLATALVAGLVIVSTRDIPKKETLYAPAEADVQLAVRPPEMAKKNIPAAPPAQWRTVTEPLAAKKNSIQLKEKAIGREKAVGDSNIVSKMAASPSNISVEQMSARGTTEKESSAGMRRQGVASYQYDVRDAMILRNPSSRVIRSLAEWKNLWDSPPAVDFSNQMVIAVFDGKIVSHKIENGKLVVKHRTLETSVQNRPTDWLAVPVFDGPVEFLLANRAE